MKKNMDPFWWGLFGAGGGNLCNLYTCAAFFEWSRDSPWLDRAACLRRLIDSGKTSADSSLSLCSYFSLSSALGASIPVHTLRWLTSQTLE